MRAFWGRVGRLAKVGSAGEALQAFEVRELEHPAPAAPLFRRSFGAEPPSIPRHFVAVPRFDADQVSAYVHFRECEPGVYLCGGLCVDTRVYRRMSAQTRTQLKSAGSLSRWLSDTSIGMLGRKRAVFAYTGNVRSRRDAFALGFELTGHPHLLVQWHDEPQAKRGELLSDVARLGPF